MEEENKHRVREAFMLWEAGDSDPFFALIADDVIWRVIGTTPLSGVYHTKKALIENAFEPLIERLNGHLATRFVDLSGEGNKLFLQFTSSGLATNGIKYEQSYCFAMILRKGCIVEIVAYLDTDLLRRVMA